MEKHVEVLSLKSSLRTCENYFTREACGSNSILLQHALHHGSVRVRLLRAHIIACFSDSPESYILFSRRHICEVNLHFGFTLSRQEKHLSLQPDSVGKRNLSVVQHM